MKCLLVYPRFTSTSFWNYLPVCDLVGAKYPAAPLGLCTVAAMLPQEWELRLVDCNTQDLKDEDLQWADIVFSGGMIAQQGEHVKLLERVKAAGKVHVVGGPDATSSPHIYDIATHLVLGEAEVTLPEFLEDFKSGNAGHLYAAGKRQADMSLTPIPRYDLLNFDNYLHVGVQFARGCPFNCEFCDIIELFGRVPRIKEDDQMLKELTYLYDLGYRGHVDFVDDNFIGNKSKAKKLLPKLRDWLEEHNWPFEFTTEATINLADDEVLLNLMQETGFSAIFVGIESPDEDTLKQTQKGQNTKRSIPESIKRINRHGIFVNAGYILGFDSEKGSVERGLIHSVRETAIPVNMIGLLTALPNTQLTRRLKKENRLAEGFDKVTENHGDQCLGGLNFEPVRSKQDIYQDYRNVIEVVYSPKEYFSRVREVTLMLDCSKKRMKLPLKHQIKDLKAFAKLIYKMGIKADYRKEFWSVLWTCVTKNPRAIRYSVALVALYLHFHPFSKYLVENLNLSLEKMKHEPKKMKLPRVPMPMERAPESQPIHA